MHTLTSQSSLTDNNMYDNTIATDQSVATPSTTTNEQVQKQKNQLIMYEELISISRHDYKDEIGTLLKKLYEDKERFYTFLMIICKHVVRKRKWKKKKDHEHYYEFITESDEAFAILLLDNNAEKYNSMNQYGGYKQSWKPPKYSRCNVRGETNGKGWSYQAQIKYFKLKIAIIKWRDNNEDQMVELAKYVNNKYRINNNEKKKQWRMNNTMKD